MNSNQIIKNSLNIGEENKAPEIPQEWEIVKLKFLLNDMVAGGTPSRSVDEYWASSSEGVPWVKISDITDQEQIKETQEHVSSQGIDEANLSVHPPGTLLVSMYASLGATSILNINATTNQAILGLYPNNSLCDTRYLQMYIKSIKSFLPALSMSNTQDNLSASKMGNIPVILPPIKTQEDLIELYSEKSNEHKSILNLIESQIDLMKSRKQSIITEVVTGQRWIDDSYKSTEIDFLDKIPSKWGTSPLKYQARFISGSTPSRSNEDYWGGEIPWISAKDMKSDVIYQTEEQLTEVALEEENINTVSKGTILILLRGMILDHTLPVCMLGRSGYLNQDVKAIISGDSLDDEYLLRLLQGVSPYILSLVEEASHGTKKLDFQQILDFRIPVPPLETQRNIIEKLQVEINQIQEILDHLQELHELIEEKDQTLISAAVTGQIDVSEV